MYRPEQRPLIVRPEYVRMLGDIYEAIILQQAVYWTSDKRGHLKNDGCYWFYKKLDDWHAEIGEILSPERISRKLKHLEKLGLLKTTTQFNKLRFDRTKWYTVDYQKLVVMVEKSRERQTRSGRNVKNDIDGASKCTTAGNSAGRQATKPETTHFDGASNSELDGASNSKLDGASNTITRDYSETTTKITNKVEQARHDTPKQKESPSQETATVIEYLNEKTGKHYRATTAKTKRLVAARLNEGFAVDDFKTVIDNKVADWTGTKWAEYLRPETLFGTKFEGYLNSTPRNCQPQNNTSWDATMTADGDFISSQPKGDEMIADEDLPFAT